MHTNQCRRVKASHVLYLKQHTEGYKREETYTEPILLLCI